MDKKIKEFMRKWEGKELEDWGSGVSKEFAAFQDDFRRIIDYLLSGIAARLVTYNKGHYEMFGFVQRDDSYFYFRYNENLWARSTPSLTDGSMLVRKVSDLMDFKGGENHYVSLEDFQQMAIRLLE